MPERPLGSSEVARSLRTLDGRYHVVDRIAAGGMGEVFRAHDAVLDRTVAIKVLHAALAGDSGFVDRFRREARSAAGLGHPNIVAVHDWGAVDGVYFMVMEFVRGQSLRELLNEEGLLAPAQAVEVLLPVLSALEHAHRLGIVHRDIKPENIMVTREGVVKVADFGLARAYADAQITQAGMVTGTVQYLAPEQLQGEPADPRTDLYSLGIVAYEMLTGRIPFTGETPMAIAYQHLRQRVPAPSAHNPAVPAGLDGWVASMTEKERELRPESAAEARRDLQSEAAHLPHAHPIAELVPDVQVSPIAPGPERATTVTIPRSRGGRHGRRRRGRWALGLVFAILAIGATAWGSWTYLIPHDVDVPLVIGLAGSEAQARLQDAGLTVKLTDGSYSTKVPEGVVIRVQPPEGVTVKKGSTVTLMLSLGPPPVPVPSLIGRPIDEVAATLKDAKLKLGDVTKAFSEKFAVGQVIRQSVRPDNEAPQGSRIDVVISKGPSPIPVLRVVGLSEEQATTSLTTAGFLVERTEDFSTDVPRGDVMAQDPVKGTQLQPGETVTITVSLGPPEFPMPNVVGMDKDAAVAKLTALGLKVDVAIVTGQTGSTVVYQKPPTGTTVHPGDLVHIFIA